MSRGKFFFAMSARPDQRRDRERSLLLTLAQVLLFEQLTRRELRQPRQAALLSRAANQFYILQKSFILSHVCS